MGHDFACLVFRHPLGLVVIPQIYIRCFWKNERKKYTEKVALKRRCLFDRVCRRPKLAKVRRERNKICLVSSETILNEDNFVPL